MLYRIEGPGLNDFNKGECNGGVGEVLMNRSMLTLQLDSAKPISTWAFVKRVLSFKLVKLVIQNLLLF